MSDQIYQAVFKIASALELPVVIAALLALALLLVELGSFVVELTKRRRRQFPRLASAADEARRRLDAGDRPQARTALQGVIWSSAMRASAEAFLAEAGGPAADVRISKQLADFDFDRQKRLSRTRLLVRAGPALGLMGTLIPLSPALDGLANGHPAQLTENLRVAFSVTVLGLFIGSVAFALSLVRDRIYGQDFSDLQYVAAVLTDDRPVPLTDSSDRGGSL